MKFQINSQSFVMSLRGLLREDLSVLLWCPDDRSGVILSTAWAPSQKSFTVQCDVVESGNSGRLNAQELMQAVQDLQAISGMGHHLVKGLNALQKDLEIESHDGFITLVIPGVSTSCRYEAQEETLEASGRPSAPRPQSRARSSNPLGQVAVEPLSEAIMPGRVGTNFPFASNHPIHSED